MKLTKTKKVVNISGKDNKQVNVAGKPRIKPMTDSEVLLWSEFMLKHEAPAGREAEIEEMSSRIVTLNDTSSIVDFITRVYDERQMNLLERIQERVALLDFIVAEKLELTAEEYSSYFEKFKEEMDKAIKAHEEAQKVDGETQQEEPEEEEE